MDPIVAQALEEFVAAARTAFGDDLLSAVLFGSAAEDRLRPTSDVNLVLVLRDFDPERADALREPLRTAEAAIRLRAMFLLAAEVEDAAEAFAVKVADIRRRHRVLYGTDPFADVEPSRAEAVRRLRQVLLNLTLRLREQHVRRPADGASRAAAATDAAGPLRSCAAELLELEGTPAPSPREALQQVAGEPLGFLSRAREDGLLTAEEAAAALPRLLRLALAMRERAERLR